MNFIFTFFIATVVLTRKYKIFRKKYSEIKNGHFEQKLRYLSKNVFHSNFNQIACRRDFFFVLIICILKRLVSYALMP